MNASLESKNLELSKLEGKLTEVLYRAIQIIKCRPPPRVYELFLKENFLSFQFNKFINDQSFALNKRHSFLSFFNTINLDEQD